MAAGSIVIDMLMNTGSFETDTNRASASMKKVINAFKELQGDAVKVVDAYDSMGNAIKQVVTSNNSLTNSVRTIEASYKSIKDEMARVTAQQKHLSEEANRYAANNSKVLESAVVYDSLGFAISKTALEHQKLATEAIQAAVAEKQLADEAARTATAQKLLGEETARAATQQAHLATQAARFATQARASVSSVAGSYDSLTNTYRRADTAQNALNANVQKSHAAFRNANQIVQNTSYQITDFVVQVQGGVSAMRAFSQQAPQFLGAFGTKGAALGVIAALAGAFLPMIVEAINGAKALKKFEDAADTAQKGIGNFSADAIIQSMKDIDAEGRKAIATLYELDVATMNKAANKQREALTGISYDITLGEEGRLQSIAEKYKLTMDQARLYMDVADNKARASSLINSLDSRIEKQAELQESLKGLVDQELKLTKAEKARAEVNKTAITGVTEPVKTRAARSTGLSDADRLAKQELASADKFADALERQTKQLEFQQNLIGRNAQEVELLNSQYRIQAELEKTIQDMQRQGIEVSQASMDKMNEAAANAIAKQQEIINSNFARRQDPMTGISDAFRIYSDQANNVALGMQNAFTNAFKGMEDGIVKFAMTGKFAFTDFANSVISDIMRIYVRQALIGMIGQIGGALFGSAGGMSAATQASTYGGASPMFSSSSMSSIPKFPGMSEGGYTGDGGKYEAKGVVHGGEFVMNKEATNRIGVGTLYRMMRGYADGGYVGGGSMPTANNAGININIKNEAGRDGYEAVATAKKNDNGIDIEVMVRKAVTSDLRNNGPMAQQMTNIFGLRRGM